VKRKRSSRDKKEDAAVRTFFQGMRRCLGLSQIVLRKTARVFRDRLSRWEKGRITLTEEEIERLANALEAAVNTMTSGLLSALTAEYKARLRHKAR
jgi:transcriptional regulator with XRE-family HTH domain